MSFASRDNGLERPNRRGFEVHLLVSPRVVNREAGIQPHGRGQDTAGEFSRVFASDVSHDHIEVKILKLSLGATENLERVEASAWSTGAPPSRSNTLTAEK